MRLLLYQLILVSCREKDTWRDFINEEVDQIKTFFEGTQKFQKFLIISVHIFHFEDGWKIILDLDDLDKYMLELHRKDRQFADLVPEPEAQNDQEFYP